MNRWLLISLCALSGAAVADTIHLKNGRTIVADVVRDKGERVEYDIGDDTYAISRTSIDSIESGVGTPSALRNASAAVPILQPKLNPADATALMPAGGEMTPELLATIEKAGNKRQLAHALLMLAHQEQEHGELDDARSHLERALTLLPDDSNLLAHYVSVLLQSERASIAESYAEDAVRKAPNSAMAHKLLGLAYFKTDQTRRALEEWKRARELDPDPDPILDKYLAAVTRQESVEADFRRDASVHFVLRYEGGKASQELREQILATLERHFGDLVSSLGVLPRDNISVVLYTNQAFFDVTQAPNWTAALNDGKLRIPIEGITQVTPEMSRVLKHELAHSFINQATRGHCPHWLHEGIAQMVEPKSAARYSGYLAQTYSSGQQVPLQRLEASFMGYSSTQATLAYVESLAYVEYIRDTYGISRITDVLRYLNEGENPESALVSAIHSNYAQLEEEFARHLRSR